MIVLGADVAVLVVDSVMTVLTVVRIAELVVIVELAVTVDVVVVVEALQAQSVHLSLKDVSSWQDVPSHTRPSVQLHVKPLIWPSHSNTYNFRLDRNPQSLTDADAVLACERKNDFSSHCYINTAIVWEC